MHVLRRLVSARQGFEVFVGVLAVSFGVFLTIVLVAAEGIRAQAFLPLVFVVYGVIHILVFTDVRDSERRRKRLGQDC